MWEPFSKCPFLYTPDLRPGVHLALPASKMTTGGTYITGKGSQMPPSPHEEPPKAKKELGGGGSEESRGAQLSIPVELSATPHPSQTHPGEAPVTQLPNAFIGGIFMPCIGRFWLRLLCASSLQRGGLSSAMLQPGLLSSSPPSCGPAV